MCASCDAAPESATSYSVKLDLPGFGESEAIVAANSPEHAIFICAMTTMGAAIQESPMGFLLGDLVVQGLVQMRDENVKVTVTEIFGDDEISEFLGGLSG